MRFICPAIGASPFPMQDPSQSNLDDSLRSNDADSDLVLLLVVNNKRALIQQLDDLLTLHGRSESIAEHKASGHLVEASDSATQSILPKAGDIKLLRLIVLNNFDA